MTDQPGALLRDWRVRRRLSQLDLAHRTGVSSRHLSFVETGRSRPSSDMILRLCDQLAVPLREQNRCLLAAGFAPAHPEHGLGDPPLAEVAAAIEQILTAHLPHPALVVDAGWDLVAANDALYALLDGIPARLSEPPVNVVRLTLDPEGLAPSILNLAEWHDHLLHRLVREHELSHDSRLAELLAELDPAPRGPAPGRGLVVPLRLRTGDGVQLSFLSTTTVFGTAHEVTVSELAIEAFYPADDATRAHLSAQHHGRAS